MERALKIGKIEERERAFEEKRAFIDDCGTCNKDQCRVDDREKAKDAAMGVIPVKK